MNQTAIVFGATGLVGSRLVRLLVHDTRFSEIKVFTRHTSSIENSKIKEYIIDFDHPENWDYLVKGDVLFSALGTTIKKAGNKKAQYAVDYMYQFEAARAASENGVPVYVLVSAAFASVKSPFFYSRIKGKLEEDIAHLPFKYIHIIRPGILKGKRNEFRMGERVGITFFQFLNHLGIARSFRPIDAQLVAHAMINVSFNNRKRLNIYSLLQIFKEANAIL